MNKYMKIKANSKVFGVILFIGFIITTICMQLSHGDIFAEIFFFMIHLIQVWIFFIA